MPTPTPAPTTGAEALADEFDRPGVLLTEVGGTLDPALFAALWDLRAEVNHLRTLHLPAPPDPRPDAAGRTGFTIRLGKTVRLVGIVNDDGSIRCVAVRGPSGGDGPSGEPIYYSTQFADALLVDVFDHEAHVFPALGIDASVGSRAGLDREVVIGAFRYRYLATPEDGEWLFVTSP